jgi:esterase/lipase superfamily enzyme
MYVTPAFLHAIADRVPDSRRHEQERIINAISLNINEELTRTQIVQADDLALFFALIAVDSSGFGDIGHRSSQRSASERFGARGLLKIEGEENYRKFGARLDVDLHKNVQLVAEPTFAMRLACEVWSAHYSGQLGLPSADEIAREFASRGRPFDHDVFQKLHDHAQDVVQGRNKSSAFRSRSTGASYTVWYGTNRRPNPDGLGYSSLRDEVIHYGTCEVVVPKSHKIGAIGSSLIKRIVSGEDDRIRIERTLPIDAELFWQALQHLFEPDGHPSNAIVFLHGYNVSFESAAIRAAQMGYDLSAQRAMAFFSWPSQGTLRGYLADAATIEVSEAAIAEFLIEFVERSGADKINLIAHSMGNRGMLRAINRIAERASGLTGKPFGQIVLAAADVDSDLFKQQAAAYVALSKKTSIYVSPKDKAVEVSHWLHEFPRVGVAPPTITVDGIDTINVLNADLSLLGHGYFAEARSVLTDLHDLIVHEASPEMRFGLRKATDENGHVYWQLKS